LVYVGGDIASHTRIDILIPGSAHISVLVEDRQFDAGDFDWKKDSCSNS
jgi:hypothetical protein